MNTTENGHHVKFLVVAPKSQVVARWTSDSTSRRPSLSPETSLPPGKVAKCAQQVHLSKRRPVRVDEGVLGKGRLPQEEPREPRLAARANDEIDIGKVRGVEVASEAFGVDRLGKVIGI